LALSVPNFGPIIDLIGASTTLVTGLIFPVIFYFYLNAAGNLHKVIEKMSKLQNNKAINKGNKELDFPRPAFNEMLQYNDKR
jgi:hypothetical protein